MEENHMHQSHEREKLKLSNSKTEKASTTQGCKRGGHSGMEKEGEVPQGNIYIKIMVSMVSYPPLKIGPDILMGSQKQHRIILKTPTKIE